MTCPSLHDAPPALNDGAGVGVVVGETGDGVSGRVGDAVGDAVEFAGT